MWNAAYVTMISMNLTLSWDLFIIVFFSTVMAYGFIIGKTQSVKVIIASYISILATQGIGNVLARLLGKTESILATMGVLESQTTILSVTKITLFIVFVIVLTIRSGVNITYEDDQNSLVGLLFTALFGLSTAGLIVSTILTYAMGDGILDPLLTDSLAITGLIRESMLMQIMILNQDLWFTLPALLLVGTGFVKRS